MDDCSYYKLSRIYIYLTGIWKISIIHQMIIGTLYRYFRPRYMRALQSRIQSEEKSKYKLDFPSRNLIGHLNYHLFFQQPISPQHNNVVDLNIAFSTP